MNKIGFQIEKCRTCDGIGAIDPRSVKEKMKDPFGHVTTCPECSNAKIQLYPTEAKESMERELYEGLKELADGFDRQVKSESGIGIPLVYECYANARKLIKKYKDSLK